MNVKYTDSFIVEVVEYIINTKASQKTTAENFGISINTVFNYCNRYIKNLDNDLYLKVKDVARNNQEDKTNRNIIWHRKNFEKKIDKMVENKFKELDISYNEFNIDEE